MKRLDLIFYAVCIFTAIQVPSASSWALRVMVLMLIGTNAALWWAARMLAPETKP